MNGHETNTLTTKNSMGRNTEEPTEYGWRFIEYAQGCANPIVDIGCGAGVVTVPALRAGATVIAIDLEPEHLRLLGEQCTNEEKKRLVTICGRFPEEVRLCRDSVSAVHAANLFNFLSGDELQQAAKIIHSWLVPGGRLFSISGTPYVATLANFIPVYEARNRRGDPWPGEINRLQDFSDHFTARELPDEMHFLDDDILRRVFLEEGFEIDHLEMYLREGLPRYLSLDGRENVGLVASKPQ